MQAVGSGSWLVVSAALHGLLTCALLWTTHSAPRNDAVAHDVWQNDWVAIEMGAPSAPEKLEPARTQARSPLLASEAPAAAKPEQRVAAATRDTEPLPQRPRREALAAPAPKREAAVARRHPPAPAPAAKEDDWLGESGSLDALPAPSPAATAKPDPFIARLLAAEQRKAAQREGQERETSPFPPKVTNPPTSAAALPEVALPEVALPAGVRDLALAVTRAIPYAANADPAWDTLPIGLVGRLELVLTLTDGKLQPLTDHASDAPSPALRRLQANTLALLHAGRFALREAGTQVTGKMQSGKQHLEITVRLSQQATRDALALGFRAPKGQKPGNAYFILPSGRRLDAEVKLPH